MTNATLQKALMAWPDVAPLLTPPQTEEDYDALVEALDQVLDDGGADENHPLARLANYLGDLISEYDQAQYDIPPAATSAEMLQHLMTVHGLRQSDLPEIGSQGVVSEVLSGKRTLNLRQIKALAARFGVQEQNFL